jgi:hypothetical protein
MVRNLRVAGVQESRYMPVVVGAPDQLPAEDLRDGHVQPAVTSAERADTHCLPHPDSGANHLPDRLQ